MSQRSFSQGTSSFLGATKSAQGLTGKQNQSPKGFWAKLRFFVFQMKGLMFKGYRNSRKIIWVSSTAFIFLMAPFLFSHFQEFNDELLKIKNVGGQAFMGGPGGSY